MIGLVQACLALLALQPPFCRSGAGAGVASASSKKKEEEEDNVYSSLFADEFVENSEESISRHLSSSTEDLAVLCLKEAKLVGKVERTVVEGLKGEVWLAELVTFAIFLFFQ